MDQFDIRFKRKDLERRKANALHNVKLAEQGLSWLMSQCKHPNAKKDVIENISYCPDCYAEWGSGRAHY